MTLDDVMREIKQNTTVVMWDNDPDRPSNLAPTGEEYLSLCSGGFKPEGVVVPCMCVNKDIAIGTWRAALFEYARVTPGILYWRTEPELCEEDELDETHRFYVYSRLLISNKIVVRFSPKRHVA